MKNVLEEMLAHRINELKRTGVHGQKILNKVKEDLHFIVLNFLYSHKIYKDCVMYGGSALRILYGLPRMSVDLDFQIDFPFSLEGFKKEIIAHFRDKYGYSNLGVNTSDQEKETIVVWMTFPNLDKFNIPNIRHSKLKVRLDFNKFETKRFQKVLVPKRTKFDHFNIKTYPISTLMASKIAAVLSRTQYCVPDEDGKSVLANYKGRDIYDLIWYMQEGVIPHLGYLDKKGHYYKSYPSLFKKLKERLRDLGDGGEALKADLSHLYLNPDELDTWMKEWNVFFLQALQKYSDLKIGCLEDVKVLQDFDSEHFIFKYYYKTDLDKKAIFRVEVSEIYIEDFKIRGTAHSDISPQIGSGIDGKNEKTAIEYAGLFYSKIEDFLARINRISPRLKIRTKLIVYNHGDYDPETLVSFANKELEACQFEDLL